MREDYRTKGKRYVGEGRLTVEHVDQLAIRARCRGGGEEYECGHQDNRWWCTCPALSTCSHIAALQLVTRRPG